MGAGWRSLRDSNGGFNMKLKYIIIAVVVVALIVGGIFLLRGKSNSNTLTVDVPAVAIGE